MSESQRICSLSILRKHIVNRQNQTKILFHMIIHQSSALVKMERNVVFTERIWLKT